MRRNILIPGLVLVVVGIILLAFTGLPSFVCAWLTETPIYERHSERDEIEPGYFAVVDFDVPAGTRLEFSFSSNTMVDFGVLDSENFEKWRNGEPFYTIHVEGDVSRAEFAFETPKADKFYFVIDPRGAGSASYTYSYTVLCGGPLTSLVAMGVIVVGAVVAYVGFRLKPKIAIPPRLLDLVKTRGRIKIDQLAQELGTTEAHVETGVYELMRARHPIRFEAETREVVYG